MYKARYFCMGCDKQLSEHEKIYSDGVCPYCDRVTHGTIIATIKKAVKEDN